jgi:hypothetical protein
MQSCAFPYALPTKTARARRFWAVAAERGKLWATKKIYCEPGTGGARQPAACEVLMEENQVVGLMLAIIIGIVILTACGVIALAMLLLGVAIV